MFSILSQKYCTKCGEWKSKSNFPKDKSKGDGYSTQCKSCKYASTRKWVAENPEKKKVGDHNWRANNRERDRANHRKWKLTNPEKVSKSIRDWQKAHPEKVRAKSLAWARANPDKHREAFRNWSTPEKEAERRRRRYDADPEAENAKSRVRNQKRRALVLGNGGVITKDEWNWLKEFYDFTCLRCGKREPEIKLTLDHVLPLTMGGKNVIENVQPLCQPCNSSKHNKHIDYRPKRSLF